MRNPHGTPIWYELMTADPAASRSFYEHAIGWKIGAEPAGGPDYRMIDTGEGLVGGMLGLTPEMLTHGATPAWLFYVGVDDVDATVAKAMAGGGTVRMPATDMPGVGRFALLADPQGIPFYVMRGAGDDNSTAFDLSGIGKCGWNELLAPDQDAGDAFYRDLFGWAYPGVMPMGPMGEYRFIAVGDTTFGGTMPQHEGSPSPGWRFYFRTPDIGAAATRVAEAGGTVEMGPMEVPGGDRVIVASDPHGVVFGIVAGAGGAP